MGAAPVATTTAKKDASGPRRIGKSLMTNIVADLHTPEDRKSLVWFGRKVFGNAFDFMSRSANFHVNTPKAIEYFLSCLEVIFINLINL